MFKKFTRSEVILEVLLIIILIGLTLFTWFPLTLFGIEGLGLHYLIKEVNKQLWTFPNLANFNTSAVVLGILLPRFFGMNYSLYFWTEVITMLVTAVMYFYLIKAITKSLFLSFFGALMFSINYFGTTDIFASSIYAYFIERIPSSLFLIPSLMLLHLFLEKKRYIYYISSVTLFFLGLGIGHFAVLITGPYLIYPIAWFLFNEKRGLRSFFKFLSYGLSYFVITSFFAYIQYQVAAGSGPGWSFFEFLLNPYFYNYPEKMFRELVYWSSYLPIFEIFKNGYPLYPPSPLYFFVTEKKSMLYGLQVALAYVFATGIIYYKLPKYRALLITIILGVGSIFYLNAYFGSYVIMSQPGSNRYLYYPTFFLVIFWLLFLWVAFWRKGLFMKIICLGLITVYYLLNTWLIRDSLIWKLEKYNVTTQIWDYVTEERPTLEKGTLVILPARYTDSNTGTFFNEQIGENEVVYITDTENWQKVATNSSNIIKIDFDKKCKCVTKEVISQEKMLGY